MPADTADAPSSVTIRALRGALLRWYDRHRRDLPWRSDPPDPYHVFVSEAMLQQTQVATVVDYFQRFIVRFSTIHALAEADEQEVLHAWQGLGYYRRARHLHAAARMIVERHGGRIPCEVDELLKLPGVGRYTAGAIASIAFGKRVPLVDGNVARVLARWFAIDSAIDDRAVQASLWDLAERLVPPGRPGDFNQALMELGAMVCTPASPACLTCPVRGHCAANQRGQADSLPVKGQRSKPRAVEHHVLAIERRGRYLFERRPASGLWSNMWQLPTAESLDDSSPQALRKWTHDTFGLQIAGLEHFERFDHQTTHRFITFRLWRAGEVTGRLRPGRGRWRTLASIDDLPLSNPQRRIVAILSGER